MFPLHYNYYFNQSILKFSSCCFSLCPMKAFCLVKLLVNVLIFLYPEIFSSSRFNLCLTWTSSSIFFISFYSSALVYPTQISPLKTFLWLTSPFQQMALLFRLNNLSTGQGNYSPKIFFWNNRVSVCVKLTSTHVKKGKWTEETPHEVWLYWNHENIWNLTKDPSDLTCSIDNFIFLFLLKSRQFGARAKNQIISFASSELRLLRNWPYIIYVLRYFSDI